MYEWVLLRVVILGVLLGGGLLFALAAMAFDRWRARRRRVSSAPKSKVAAANQIVAARYPANLSHLYRWRESRADANAARQSRAATAKSQTN